ncbi:uncharacterized protein LOC105832695 [Monomorium pharaonis]|uniref:uncharacterized protein LOC105832695 n=1 Tax=Monomorium pharaonis TaxID=307658 RepID=UPI00063F2B34|nr:uncharacterized protein LOC105832695 [Monomorium pharaonis]
MNSSTFVGNPDVMIAGPPPPPPPPPPASGHLPAMRINTAENTTAKRPQVVNNDAYEPPAAIQNAMLTKDKKPFTYTPGMGGKLDLSQIRSPRMARRVAKNANDEGIEGPPKSAIESKPTSPAASSATNLLMPQVAVPVFPSNVPPPPPNRMSSSINRTMSNAVDKSIEPARNITKVVDKPIEPVRNITKVDTKIVPIPITSSQSSTPESPGTPTQVTLAKAPTPWMQNKNKPQEELPEWAKRTSTNKTVGSDPLENAFSPVHVQVQQSSPQYSQVKQKQDQKPYSNPQQQMKPQQLSQQSQQQRQNTNSIASQQTKPQQERIIPIQIEDRPSVFDVKRESGHHQFKQPPTMHHQQRWGQVPAQHTLDNQAQNYQRDQNPSQIYVTSPSPQPQQSVGTTYIIPLVVEGSEKRTVPSTENNIKIGKPVRVAQQRSIDLTQQEPGPVQSRSFRVLQKITDTDDSSDVGTEQIRRMELSEDEKLLMNKFKEQVDHETYLHQEKDPRYRGAAIPSRAFRFLQNMTDSNDTSVINAAPHNVQNATNKRQNRNSKSFEEIQANLPPSEQQVQEPKKYMGSAIPSRSFRILQAMTASENDATQENRQADYTCRTENNLPGNQQDVFFSPQPVSFWSHSEGWWGYYPVQCNAPFNKPANGADEHSFPYLRYPDKNAYIGYEFFYPVYDENFADVAQTKGIDQKNSSGQYVTVICPQAGCNDVQQSHVDTNNCNYIHNCCITRHPSPARNDRYFMPDNMANKAENTLPNEINHLDAQSSGTFDPKNVCENKDKNYMMAMNIVDEEDGISDNPKTRIFNNIEKSRKTFGLHINVPNYTYIDTSDSSNSNDCSDSNDSSDSSDSISDNEHFSDLKYNDTSNNILSSSDSDSYEGYSVGLNPYNKVKKDQCIISSDKNCTDFTVHSECSISDDHSYEYSQNDFENTHRDKILPKGNYIDCSNDQNSCAMLKQDSMCTTQKDYTDNQSNLNSCSSKINSINNRVSNTRSDEESSTTDNINSHELNVIREDVERSSSESLHYESKKKIDERNETSFEMTDDPPDDTEITMVSVSLPLKFKFSVSENNEDVTTVTVGNSKIMAEKSCGEYSMKKDENNENDDVCVNFHIGNDTSVDFTVKKHASDVICPTTKTENKARIETAIPQVDFTFKRDSTNDNEINCTEQNTEIEFPVTKTDCQEIIELVSENADITSELTMASEDVLVNDENCIQTKFICNNFEHNDINRTTAESESVTSEGFWMQNFETLQDVDQTNQTNQQNCCVIVDNNIDRCIDPELSCQTDTNYLMVVQDSREDTDDEDSGVTSDTSRMISENDTECRELDTDSECTISKNPKKYQRTQTHSRLFRLLNNNSILSDCKADSCSKKEYLSLPLKTNYDDSYCSNYSSGLTSPEYSPIHEQSCRKFHDATINGNTVYLADVKRHHSARQQSEQIPSKSNSDFPVWKSTKLPSPQEHDVMPSLAFKILNSKTPLWTYKVNVLCPRIKSTKSVPQALLARQIDKN